MVRSPHFIIGELFMVTYTTVLLSNCFALSCVSVGSTESVTQPMWVTEDGKMVHRPITYVSSSRLLGVIVTFYWTPCYMIEFLFDFFMLISCWLIPFHLITHRPLVSTRSSTRSSSTLPTTSSVTPRWTAWKLPSTARLVRSL